MADVPMHLTTMTTDQPTHDIHHLEAQRRANRDAVAALGVNPYGRRTPDLISLDAARALHDPKADQHHADHAKDPGFTDTRPIAKVAGRVMLRRDTGGLLWLNLRDHSGDIQLAISKRDADADSFNIAKLTDLGDVVLAQGRVMKTRAGEITLWADSFTLAAKSLVTPPEKHAGLQDPELRYRHRYIDLYANPETISTFFLRSALIARARRLLDARGYLEVETPMLQTLAGGAAARPFATHMNALDIALFLRIAPELYLKRLLVAGFPKVYEINRNFRNEGLDRNHNPEFTMLEAYEAFGDVHTMMELTESLCRELATLSALHHANNDAPEDALPTPEELRLPFGDTRIDFASPFLRIPYPALFEKALGFPMTDARRARKEAARRRLKHEGLDDVLVINTLFEHVAEPTLDHERPTFITDYPASISPLTRPKPDNPALADRADLFIAGIEIAPHYTELNDPDVQAEKFKQQLAGADDEESTFRTFDHDFIHALKVGMPPAGGMGLGIDRLVMILANQKSIRDAILFPLLRPAPPIHPA